METTASLAALRQFNDTIGKWIGYLDHYTLDKLQQAPPDGSWSLGQVYIHLIDDTGYFVEQIQAALSTPTHSDQDMHPDAKAIFARNGFPDMKLDGPSTGCNIRQPQSREELRQGLSQIRDTVNRLYADFDFEKAVGKTRHPGLLFFSATEWLRFAEMHMRHHFRQKQRIDQALG